MTFVIGIDGGGTNMRAVVVDEGGDELGRYSTDGAVATALDPGRAADAVERAVHGVVEVAGIELPAAVLFAGLAGGGGSAARSGVTAALDGRGLAEVVVVGTDVEAAFEDAFQAGPGLIVIAGTGSVAWGRNAAGDVHRVGGWGKHLGDDGSGYSIGMGALRGVVRAKDGRSAEARVTPVVLEATGCASVEELVPWAASATKAQVAALAPLVIAQWDNCLIAQRVVSDAVHELLEHVETMHEVLDTENPGLSVALWGGLVAPGGPLRSRLLQDLNAKGYTVRKLSLDPPMGAARIALSWLP